MSTGTNGVSPPYVLSEDFEDLEEHVDDLRLDVRSLKDGMGRIELSLERIETRLGSAESKVGAQSHIVEGFALAALEERKDVVQASKEHRKGLWAVAGKASAFIFSVAGASLILSTVLKGCGSPEPAKGEDLGAPPTAIVVESAAPVMDEPIGLP